MGAGGEPQPQKASNQLRDIELQQALDSYQASAVRRLQYRVDRILTPLLHKTDLLRFSVQFSALLDECLSAVASSTARGATFLAPLPSVRDDSACPHCLSQVSHILAQHAEHRSEQQTAFVDWLKASCVPVTSPRLPVVPVVHAPTTRPSSAPDSQPRTDRFNLGADSATGNVSSPRPQTTTSRTLRRRRPPPYFGGINVDALVHLHAVEKRAGAQDGTGGSGATAEVAVYEGAATGTRSVRAATARGELTAAIVARQSSRVAAGVEVAAAAAANASACAELVMKGVGVNGADGSDEMSRAVAKLSRASRALDALRGLMRKEAEACSLLCSTVGGVQGMGVGPGVGPSQRGRSVGRGVAVVEAPTSHHQSQGGLPTRAGLPLSVAFGRAPDVLRKLAGAVSDGTGAVLGVAATAGLVETQAPPPPRGVKVYGIVSRSAAVVFGSPLSGDHDASSVSFAPLGAKSLEYVVRVYSDVLGVVEVFGGEQFGERGADVVVDSTARVAQHRAPHTLSDVDHAVVFEEVVKGSARGSELRVPSLQPATKYVVVVSVRNAVGEGRGTGVLFCTAAAPPTTVDGVDSYGSPCVYADVPAEHKPQFGGTFSSLASHSEGAVEVPIHPTLDTHLPISRPSYSDDLFRRAPSSPPRFAVVGVAPPPHGVAAPPSGEASHMLRDGVSVVPPEGLGCVEGGNAEVSRAARMEAVAAAAEIYPGVSALCEASRGVPSPRGGDSGAPFPSPCIAALGLAVFVTYGGASVRGGGVFVRPPAGVRHAAESIEGGGRATYHTARALLQWSAVGDESRTGVSGAGHSGTRRPPPLPVSAPFYRGTWEGEGVRTRADGIRVPVATVGAYDRGCGTYTVDVDTKMGKSQLRQLTSGDVKVGAAADTAGAAAAGPLPRGVCAEDVAIEAALGMLAVADSCMPYGV